MPGQTQSKRTFSSSLWTPLLPTQTPTVFTSCHYVKAQVLFCLIWRKNIMWRWAHKYIPWAVPKIYISIKALKKIHFFLLVSKHSSFSSFSWQWQVFFLWMILCFHPAFTLGGRLLIWSAAKKQRGWKEVFSTCLKLFYLERMTYFIKSGS